jgi:hypothetical protein
MKLLFIKIGVIVKNVQNLSLFIKKDNLKYFFMPDLILYLF